MDRQQLRKKKKKTVRNEETMASNEFLQKPTR